MVYTEFLGAHNCSNYFSDDNCRGWFDFTAELFWGFLVLKKIKPVAYFPKTV